MGKIITIAGPHGVGKTTLFEYAKKQEEFSIHDGFKIQNELFSDFDLNQLKYLEKIMEQNSLILKDTKDSFIIRSVEEILYFYEIENKKCSFQIPVSMYSDFIIYLTCEYSVLISRCKNDKNRNMFSTLEWYKNQYEIYDQFWKTQQKVIVIDTTILTPEEVYEKVKESVCSQK